MGKPGLYDLQTLDSEAASILVYASHKPRGLSSSWQCPRFVRSTNLGQRLKGYE
jgi:hypothetical protein